MIPLEALRSPAVRKPLSSNFCIFFLPRKPLLFHENFYLGDLLSFFLIAITLKFLSQVLEYETPSEMFIPALVFISPNLLLSKSAEITP